MEAFRFAWNQLQDKRTSNSTTRRHRPTAPDSSLPVASTRTCSSTGTSSIKDFSAILDASTHIVELSESLQTHYTNIKSARAYIHESFSGRLPSEVLVFFEALGSRPKLQKLYLGFHRRHYAPLPLQALSLSLIQASRLVLLEVCGLEIDGTRSDFTTLAASLHKHPSLEEIKLSNCRIAENNVNNNNNHNDNPDHPTQQQQLENEDDDNNQKGEEENPLDALVRSLATIPTLRRMILQSSTQDSLGKLLPESLGTLLQKPNNLQALGLLGFTFQERHLLAISNALCCSSSSSNSESSSSVKELYLGTIQLGTKGDEALARILRQQSSSSLRTHADPLQQQQRRQHDKNQNHHSCSSLEYLDLQFQDHESPVEIARSLPHNNTLQHFFIHGNLTPISQQAFAQAIQHNYHLQSLELMNGSVHLEEIRFYLRMNTMVGRAELLLEHNDNNNNNNNSPRTKWVDKLIAQREDVSAIFYLLSRNPLLCSVVS